MDTLFWIISKVYSNLASPNNGLLILLVLGVILLWTRFKLAGKWLVSMTTGILLIFAVLPVSFLILLPLEERFPAPTTIPDKIDGIIVLAGAEEASITAARGQPSIDGGAERLTTFVALARIYPEARLVFTGGMGGLTNQKFDRTVTARKLFDQLGLDSKRVEYENKSRNTAESATYTYEMIKPRNQENWILVTSASHIPRSVGVFRKVGWDVIPYPVDYKTTGEARLHNSGLIGTYWAGVALHEWIGLLAYRITGKTSELFPSPSSS